MQKVQRNYEKTIKNEKREAWRQWAETLSPRTSVKEIFKKFRRLNNYREPNQPNVMYNDPEKVEEFLKRMCAERPVERTTENESTNTEEPFLVEELDEVLSQKEDSAPGMNGIKYGMIRLFPEGVKEKFLQLINELWASQNIPQVLKRILMVLIPKPGRDLNLLNSHRPIALLSVYLKVINSMVKTRLENLIKNQKMLDDRSYGFVKGKLAIDCINHLLSVVREKNDEKQNVMGIFLDIEDAFSNVNLEKFKCVASRLGIPRQFTAWIINCYQEREITVETIRGEKSAKTSKGIPMGDVLSPTIFLLYTSGIFEWNEKNAEMFQFADWERNSRTQSKYYSGRRRQILTLTDLDTDFGDYDRGRFRIICGDTFTKDCIIETTPKLQNLWPDAKLKVITSGPPPDSG